MKRKECGIEWEGREGRRKGKSHQEVRRDEISQELISLSISLNKETCYLFSFLYTEFKDDTQCNCIETGDCKND